MFELLSERLYLLARRMLSRYPRVRRWNDTDDVFQAAAMRLHRALADTQPESVRGLLALAGTQMHRELIDLARRYTSQGAYEANHGTNVIGEDDSGRALHAVDHASQEQEPLDRWSAFHKAVEQLPAEAREVFDLVWYMVQAKRRQPRSWAAQPARSKRGGGKRGSRLSGRSTTNIQTTDRSAARAERRLPVTVLMDGRLTGRPLVGSSISQSQWHQCRPRREARKVQASDCINACCLLVAAPPCPPSMFS